MIIKINGQVFEDRQKETMQVKTESFSWEPVTSYHQEAPVEEPKNNITLREKLVEVKEKIKSNFNPVFTGVNLLAAVPAHAMAGQFGVTATSPISSAVPAATTSFGGMGIGSALSPVIAMLQELALPVGIGMAIWGLIEVIVGNYGGKDKIKWSILGYIGVYLIPFAFFQIKNSFSLLPIG